MRFRLSILLRGLLLRIKILLSTEVSFSSKWNLIMFAPSSSLASIFSSRHFSTSFWVTYYYLIINKKKNSVIEDFSL